MNTIDIFPKLLDGFTKPCDVWVNRFPDSLLKAFRTYKCAENTPQDSPARWHGIAPSGLPTLKVFVHDVPYLVPFLINHSSPTTILPVTFLQNIGIMHWAPIGYVSVVDFRGNIVLLDLIKLPIRLSVRPKDICLTEVALIQGAGLGTGVLGRDALCRHLIGVNHDGTFCAQAATVAKQP